jgi:hypothetical protein
VHTFSHESAPFEKIPIGTAATAWTDSTGHTYILRLNQALLFGTRLSHSLLCPNQLRHFGHNVDDVPVQFDRDSTHSITLRSELAADTNLMIPLMIKGVVSYFPSYYPTTHELDTCPHINLTSDAPWDPNSPAMANLEESLTSRIAALSVNGDDIWENMSLSDVPDEHTFQPPNDDEVYETHDLPTSFTNPPELLDESEFANRMIEAVTRSSSLQWDDAESTFVDKPEPSFCPYPTVEISALTTKGKQLTVTPEDLARRWGIGKELASRTLKVTTQRGIRNFGPTIEKRYDTKLPHLMYPIMKGTRFYTDTLFAGTKSIRLNQVAQIWTDGNGYCLFFPLASKAQAPATIKPLMQHLKGIPEVVISDGAREVNSLKWNAEINNYRVHHHVTEPHSQWQNKAEAEIREVKRMIKHHMYKSKCPKRFWCYCGEWISAIRRFIAHNIPALAGTNPYELIHARTADISEYVQFDWYQFVWFLEPSDGLTPRRSIGRWLGVAVDTGSPLCYYVLNSNGNVLRRSSVAPVKPEEMSVDSIKERMKEHDDNIIQRFGDDVPNPELVRNVNDIEHFEYHLFDDDDDDMVVPVDPEMVTPEADEMQMPDVFDQYLTANIMVERQGQATRGTVMRRAKDAHSLPIGKAHPNPILDTREWEVEYPDGSMDVLTANTIAESLYSRVDAEGHEHIIMQEILDHKFDGNLLPRDDLIIPGTNQMRRTTKGCRLLISWKDGSSTWVPLADMKESYPVQVAEFRLVGPLR